MSKAIDRQQDIIFHVARLFREKGYPATSIRDIGEALGFSSSALYYHFESKDALLLEVMLQGVRAVHHAVEQAMEGETSIYQRIRAGLRAHLLESLEYQDFAAVLLQEMRYLNADDRRKVVDVRDAYESLWTRTLTEGLQAGLFRSEVDLHLLRLLGFGAMNWVVIWYKSDGKNTPEEIADAFLAQR